MQGPERTISSVLKAGTIAAAVVTGAGAVAYLLRHWGDPADYTRFSPGASDLRGFAATARAALRLDPAGVMLAGIIILMLTPVARVGVAAGWFARRREALFAAICIVVLGVLAMGLAGAVE